jgi:hypothetical protein
MLFNHSLRKMKASAKTLPHGVCYCENTILEPTSGTPVSVLLLCPHLFGTKQFDGKHHRDNLIHLPSDQTENVKALIEQLITWSPNTKGKTDMVMALWFCEIRAREMLNQGMHKTHHMKNPFLSRYEVGKRTVVNIDELLADKDRTFI